ELFVRPARRASSSEKGLFVSRCGMSAMRPTPRACANPDTLPTQAVKTYLFRLVASNGAYRARGFRASGVSGLESEDHHVGADGEARAPDPRERDRMQPASG